MSTYEEDTKSAVKLATMDLSIQHIRKEMHDMAIYQKELSEKLDVIGRANLHTDGLLQLVNTNAQRSDERWQLMAIDRKQDRQDWFAWRSDVDKMVAESKGSVRVLKWIVSLFGASIAAAVVGWLTTK